MGYSKLATPYHFQDFGAIRWYAPRSQKVTTIVIHHAATTNFDAMPGIWTTREASAHYGIGQNGAIRAYVDENNAAWACGSGNQYTINIECTNLTGNPEWKVSDATIDSLVALIQEIQTRYGKLNIVGHRDIPGNSTACPGPYLYARLNQIRERVNGQTVTPIIPDSNAGNGGIGSNLINKTTSQVADFNMDVYTSQTMASPIIRQVKKGTIFTSNRQASGQNPDGNGYIWFEIENSGWVYGGWCSPVTSNSSIGSWKIESGIFVPNTTINVRDSASTSGNIVASYSSGESVNYDKYLIDQNGYVWIHYISYDGKDRYMATGNSVNSNRTSYWGSFY